MPISLSVLRFGKEQAAQRLDSPTYRRRLSRGAADGETQTVTQTFTPVGEAPAIPQLPEFQAPEFEESRISKKAQQIAAPQVRRLRRATRTALATQYENPNVRRMTVREALAGYGAGLESVVAGSRRAAAAEEAETYGREFTAAQLNYQAQVQAAMQQYNNLWNLFLRSGTTTTTTAQPGAGTGQFIAPGYLQRVTS